MNSEHNHTWVFEDTYFNHNEDSIHDLYVCECGEEKKLFV